MTTREAIIEWATALPVGARVAIDLEQGYRTLYHVGGASYHEVGDDADALPVEATPDTTTSTPTTESNQ